MRPIQTATWRPHANKYEAVVHVAGERFFLGYYSEHAEAVRMKQQFKRYANDTDAQTRREFAETAREHARNLAADERERNATPRRRTVPLDTQIRELTTRFEQFLEQYNDITDSFKERFEALENRLQYLERGDEAEAEALENTLAMQDELQ